MFRLFIEINSIERMINTYRWSTLDYITACVTMFASNQPKPFTGISTFTQFLFEGFIFLRCRLIRLSLCSYAVCWKLKNRKLLVGNVQDWKQKAGENHSIACSIGWGKKPIDSDDWLRARLIANLRNINCRKKRRKNQLKQNQIGYTCIIAIYKMLNIQHSMLFAHYNIGK